jgi:hypothetical protein
MEIRAFKVISCSVPKSNYMITTRNNTLTIYDSTENAHLITLPAGNYNADEMAVELQALIRAAYSGFTTFTVTFETRTARFLFHNDPAEDYQLSWADVPGHSPCNNLAEVLGFDTSTLPMYRPPVGSTGSVYSDHCINLAMSTSIAVHSTSLGPMIDRFATDSITESTDFLFSVPSLGVDFGETIEYEPAGLSFSTAGTIIVRDIDLQLKDLAGNPVSLNGIPWEILIQTY